MLHSVRPGSSRQVCNWCSRLPPVVALSPIHSVVTMVRLPQPVVATRRTCPTASFRPDRNPPIIRRPLIAGA